jgi:hypothetical protein
VGLHYLIGLQKRCKRNIYERNYVIPKTKNMEVAKKNIERIKE